MNSSKYQRPVKIADQSDDVTYWNFRLRAIFKIYFK